MKLKIGWLDIPKIILGGMFGLVIGGMAGGLFANIGYAPFIPWQAIHLWLGAILGGLIGWKIEID